MVNGRPPDPVLRVQSGPLLESSRSPSDTDVQAGYKRVRDQDSGVVRDNPFELMEMEAEQDMMEVPMQVSQDQGQNGEIHNVSTRVLYASMVRNSSSGVGNMQEDLDIDPNRVVVLNENFVINRAESCVVGRAKDIAEGKSPPVAVESDKSSGAAGNSDTLFGPWMVIDTRHRRQQLSSTVNKPSAISNLRGMGSHFMVLEPESLQQSPLILPEGRGDVQRTVADVDVDSPSVVLNVAYRASNPDKNRNLLGLWLVRL
ncbi:hypothetical protein V6N13_125062 [Hibiscus sabdariffa]